MRCEQWGHSILKAVMAWMGLGSERKEFYDLHILFEKHLDGVAVEVERERFTGLKVFPDHAAVAGVEPVNPDVSRHHVGAGPRAVFARRPLDGVEEFPGRPGQPADIAHAPENLARLRIDFEDELPRLALDVDLLGILQ